MSLLRVRIREGKRFTIFDIDPATAGTLGGDHAAMGQLPRRPDDVPADRHDRCRVRYKRRNLARRLSLCIVGRTGASSSRSSVNMNTSASSPCAWPQAMKGCCCRNAPSWYCDCLRRLLTRYPTWRSKQMQVAGSVMQLGTCKTRPIQHYPTLHAHLVTGADDEVEFVEEVESALAAMGVAGKADLRTAPHADGRRAHDQGIQSGIARPDAGRFVARAICRAGQGTAVWLRNFCTVQGHFRSGVTFF